MFRWFCCVEDTSKEADLVLPISVADQVVDSSAVFEAGTEPLATDPEKPPPAAQDVSEDSTNEPELPPSSAPAAADELKPAEETKGEALPEAEAAAELQPPHAAGCASQGAGAGVGWRLEAKLKQWEARASGHGSAPVPQAPPEARGAAPDSGLGVGWQLDMKLQEWERRFAGKP